VERERKKRQDEMEAAMLKIRETMKASSEIADQQTRLRNGKEALKERGLWLAMDRMLALKKSLDLEGWARMKSLEQRIDCVGLPKLLQASYSS
jgi:hypothetical protein